MEENWQAILFRVAGPALWFIPPNEFPDISCELQGCQKLSHLRLSKWKLPTLAANLSQSWKLQISEVRQAQRCSCHILNDRHQFTKDSVCWKIWQQKATVAILSATCRRHTLHASAGCRWQCSSPASGRWCTPSRPQPCAAAAPPGGSWAPHARAAAWHKRRRPSGSGKAGRSARGGPTGWLHCLGAATLINTGNTSYKRYLSMYIKIKTQLRMIEIYSDLRYIKPICQSPVPLAWAKCPAQSWNCFATGPCSDFGKAQLSKSSFRAPARSSSRFKRTLTCPFTKCEIWVPLANKESNWDPKNIYMIYISLSLSFSLSIYPSIHPSFLPSIHPSIYLSLHIYIYTSFDITSQDKEIRYSNWKKNV